MKKIYALLIAAMACQMSFAQRIVPRMNGLDDSRFTKEMAEATKHATKSKLTMPSATMKQTAGMRKAASVDVSGMTTISEQPEGTEKTFTKDGDYYYPFFGMVFSGSSSGMGCTIVEGTDGKYYMLDPMSGFTWGTWLTIEKESDDTYVAKLPQLLYTYDTEDSQGNDSTMYGLAMCMEEYEYEDGGETYTWLRPAENQEYRFTVKGDSIVSADPNVVLGLVDPYGDWYGYGDWNMRYAEFTDKPLEVDAAVEESALDFAVSFTDFALTDEEGNYTSRYGRMIKGAFDMQAGKVYVKGMFGSMPDAWVEGTFDGQKAVFNSRQYMGIDPDYGYFAYFCAATYGLITYEDGSEGESYSMVDNITFDVDMDAMTMTTSDCHILLNAGMNEVYYIESLYDPEVKLFVPQAFTPSDPVIYDVTPYDEDYGYGNITTYIPITDVNGNVMDADNLTYCFYIDDDKFTLSPDENVALTEEMTDIPYEFTDGFDIYSYDATHSYYFYTDGFDKIGVQSTYTYDGTSNSSNIVWFYIDGIKSATSDEMKSVKSTRYTDISGRAVANPGKGLFIQTVTFSDGSSKSTKVIK